MSIIEALVSQPLASHELLKVCRFTNVVTGPVLQEASLTAVTDIFVQYSKVFESRYVAFFDEALISNVCKDLVYFGLLQGAFEAR